MRAEIQGVSSCIRSFDYLFGVTKGEMLLPKSDNLSRILQSPKISAAYRRSARGRHDTESTAEFKE